MSPGALSYALAGGAFLLLTLLLWIGWQGRALGARFIVASLATILWAATLAWQSSSEHFPYVIVFGVELLRDGAWLAVLMGIARPILPRFLRIAIPTLWAALLAAGVLLAFGDFAPTTPDALMALSSRSGLLLSMAALVLIEQIHRAANPAARRALRYLVYGIGGMFAYDLFLYSQAELLRAVSVDAWNARGVVNALLVPLIAVSVRRNPAWSLDIFVSRHVVFYSGALVLIGAYLLFMALGGFYVREIGGAWGGLAQILFLAGSALLLTLLIGSGRIRTWIKVLLSKHFYRNKYDYRVEWLRFIQTLSSAQGSDVGSTAIQAVAQIFSSPGGLLFTIDDAGRRFQLTDSWPAALASSPQLEPLPADHDLAAFLGARQWIIDLKEYRASPARYQDITLPRWTAVLPAARLIMPLLAADRLIGFIVLDDATPSIRLTYEDRDLLKTVGRHVATQIAQHQADQRLAESRQFEAYNHLTAFMMHDLKNAVAQLQLVVANAARHKHNPAFIDDAISTIANAVERMTRLTQQLKEKALAGSGRLVDVEGLARSAVERCKSRRPVPTLEGGAPAALIQADPEKLTSVLEHVIRNAQDATPENGSIEIRFSRDARALLIEVSDSGCGMGAEFVKQQLFRPFFTTKGAEGMGIGAYQAREYVRALGGDVEVQSSPGQGTTFSIKLPLAATLPGE
ncbi:MAG TPA: XrtA/PEP-CTERM system histidine kinase PrsK [Steroidobacteraceae bacterium]|jgi:putative PEP-CTERM system histidine kinase